MYERSALSECEMVTMRCVWNLGKNATAFNVINMLAEDYGMERLSGHLPPWRDLLCAEDLRRSISEGNGEEAAEVLVQRRYRRCRVRRCGRGEDLPEGRKAYP